MIIRAIIAGAILTAATAGAVGGYYLKTRYGKTEKKTLEVTDALLDTLAQKHLGKDYARLKPNGQAYVWDKVDHEQKLVAMGYRPLV